MKQIKASATGIILLLSVPLVCTLNAHGQLGSAKDYRAPVVFRTDWECLITDYPKAQLNRTVNRAVEMFGRNYIRQWGDRAVEYDLNGDGRSEYFIPLGCSAVGNCIWGVFALYPARQIGIISAENIYVRKRVGRWSALIAYIHASAAEGVLTNYAFRNGRYKKLPGNRNVSANYPSESYLPGRLYPMPGFIGKIPSPCALGKAVRAAPR